MTPRIDPGDNNLNCRVKVRAQDVTNGNPAIGTPTPLFDHQYAGASFRRKQLNNWWPSRNPADLDIIPDQATLIARSRDLNRNNGVAAGAVTSANDNIVGTGLRLTPWPDYRALDKDAEWSDEWSQKVNALWRAWADTPACDAAGCLNFQDMTALVFRSIMENGEALILPLWLERNNTQFKTCLHLVDADRLVNPTSNWLTKNQRGGVELDDWGKPVNYYIQTVPENFSLMTYSPFFTIPGWEKVPAETSWGRKRVLHLFPRVRIDQTRGVPILAPVIEQFRMLDSYQRSELQTAIVNALVAGVIETPLDAASINEMMGGDANAYLQGKNEYRVQLESGSLIPLYPGDKLTPFTPTRPTGTFPNFVETVLRQIGTAMGMPYEILLKDFSKTNYSSARASLLEAWRFFNTRRAWLARNWAQAVYRLWLEEAIDLGLVDAPDYYAKQPYWDRAKWIGPGRGWVDPVKEAEAAQLRIQSYISTLEMECAEQGLDWAEVLEQRARENTRMAELNLIPSPALMPRATPAQEAAEPGETLIPPGPPQQQKEAA